MPRPENMGAIYQAVMLRFQHVQGREAELPIHHRCRSTLMTHGEMARKAIVYFHGFTSCPAQGSALAVRLYALGFNVYLPRMFGHGGTDPKRFSMANLNAQGLIEMAEESIEIASGLGEEVFVIGLSAGGTIASWVAQNRNDVARVVTVSPFFGPFKLPRQAIEGASRMLLKIPNVVIRWNPLSNIASQHVDYPFSLPATHALAEIMLLGQRVQKDAATRPPSTQSIRVLLNEADRSVSNAVTMGIVNCWRTHGPDVSVETLPFQHRLPHDLINPFEKGNDFERVYMSLVRLLSLNSKQCCALTGP